MTDQSLLDETQDKLMLDMTMAWEEVKADGATDPDLMLIAAERARDALLLGGSWPEPHWLEYIFMVGANCCATAVLNYNRYFDFEDVMKELYGEVVKLQWIKGGPDGYFDQHEAEGLSRAVGLWQLYREGKP